MKARYRAIMWWQFAMMAMGFGIGSAWQSHNWQRAAWAWLICAAALIAHYETKDGTP